MKLKKLFWGIVILTAAMMLVVQAAAWPAGRQGARKLNTVHFIGVTNGTVGVMATTYRGFSPNHAATIQQWFASGTNAALLRVTNHQDCAIWVQPFATVHFERFTPKSVGTIVLDAPNFSGIRLAAGQATNLQVMLPPRADRCRVHVSSTHEWTCDSFLTKLSHFPRDRRAYFTGKSIVTHAVSIGTDWIEP